MSSRCVDKGGGGGSDGEVGLGEGRGRGWYGFGREEWLGWEWYGLVWNGHDLFNGKDWLIGRGRIEG